MTGGTGDVVSIVMVGVGGYGYFYLKTLMEEYPRGKIRICGLVDPFPDNCDLVPVLSERGVPVFHTLNDFNKSGYFADLAVISSPIHFHVPQSCMALLNGSHVLCDKPLGTVVQEVEELLQARDESGKWVMIGYQWSYSSAIQSLKKDIMKGLLGKPIRLKTLCFWPRETSYYRRNDWAGKKKTEAGKWILDSPANNAMAHFLHNLFYVLGGEIDLSAKPSEVTAELYRANNIENFDSVACRAYTSDQTELLFYASHATYEDKGPMFHFEFEESVISFGESSDEIIAVDAKGKTKSYGSPEADSQFKKLFDAVDAVKSNGPIVCGPEASLSQTVCVNGIQESMPNITEFPESMIERDENGSRLWVRDLAGMLYQCYQKGALPHEIGIPWAKVGKRIDLSDYSFFPSEASGNKGSI